MATIVPVYSVAKAFTAAAALLRLDPADRIGTHLGVPQRLSGLTVGDLLSHRSGLDDYFGWDDYREQVRDRADPWPDEVVLDRASVGANGEFRYSNIGYLLVRRALEHAAGAPLFTLLNEGILSRLEVEAFPLNERSDWQHCSPALVGEDIRSYHPKWVYPGTFCADIASTARGLARIMRGDLGSGVAAAMLHTRAVQVPGHPFREPGYGLGLMTDGEPVRVVGHGGGGPGFTVFVVATPDGERWHGEAVAGEVDDRPIIERCLAALRR